MAKYIICEKCKRLIEYKPIARYEGGTSYTTSKCSECGHEKTTSVNYVHYGEDGKK